MDASYALMVRTFSAIPGSNLLEAIERTNESFGIEKPVEGKAVAADQQNQASLEQLSGMLRGVR